MLACLHAKAQGTPRNEQDSKLEARNPKQIQMTKNHKIPNKLVSDFDFRI